MFPRHPTITTLRRTTRRAFYTFRLRKVKLALEAKELALSQSMGNPEENPKRQELAVGDSELLLGRCRHGRRTINSRGTAARQKASPTPMLKV